MNNGRVSDINTGNMPSFAMTDYQADKRFNREAIKGVHGSNTLNEVFFSDTNIYAIQHGIRYLVWLNSCKKHVIDNQSEEELKVVMRSVYLQYGKNLPFNILEQVKELNSFVLEYCVSRIMSEINLYSKYRSDLSSLPVPMEHAQNISSRGSKVLEMKEF